MVIYEVDGRFLDSAKQDAHRLTLARAVFDELDEVLSRYGWSRTGENSWAHAGLDAVFVCGCVPRSPRA